MRQGRRGIAVVGLHHGSRLLGVYQRDPLADLVGVLSRDTAAAAEVAAYVGCRAYSSWEQLLAAPEVEVVHLATPPHLHADQAVAALAAGKDVLSAPPMALTLTDVRRVVATSRRTGSTYGLAETDVFTQDVDAARAAVVAGALSDLTLLRGHHVQDMRSWPSYWDSIPAMGYSSHAWAPSLVITGLEVARVSGQTSRRRPSGTPSAQVAVADAGVGTPSVLVHLDLDATGQAYGKGWELIGSVRSVRGSPDGPGPAHWFPDPPAGLIDTGLPPTAYPDYRVHRRDPSEFQTRTGTKGTYVSMVSEFLGSLQPDGRPFRAGLDAAAHWTTVGICADVSAGQDARWVEVPDLRRIE